MRPFRLYVDTSVFGGVFDDEFSTASRLFFNQVFDGRYCLLISKMLVSELGDAPPNVKDFYNTLPASCLELLEENPEAHLLADRYIQRGVISKKYRADGLHVATATLANAQAIISWNFKHIVNFRRILGYESVNIELGLHPVKIVSPLEMNND